MSRFDLRPTRAALRADLNADAEVDYMPAVRADRPPVTGRLLDAVLADARAQIDRARGEAVLFAPPGTPAAQIGDSRAEMWRARNPGLAALLDWAGCA